MKYFLHMLVFLGGTAQGESVILPSAAEFSNLAEKFFSAKPDKATLDIHRNQIRYKSIDCPAEFEIYVYPNRDMAEFEYLLRKTSIPHEHPKLKIGEQCFVSTSPYDKKAETARLIVLSGNFVVSFTGLRIPYEKLEPFAISVTERVQRQEIETTMALAQGNLFMKWDVPDGIQFGLPIESLKSEQLRAVRNDWIRLRYLITGIHSAGFGSSETVVTRQDIQRMLPINHPLRKDWTSPLGTPYPEKFNVDQQMRVFPEKIEQMLQQSKSPGLKVPERMPSEVPR